MKNIKLKNKGMFVLSIICIFAFLLEQFVFGARIGWLLGDAMFAIITTIYATK